MTYSSDEACVKCGFRATVVVFKIVNAAAQVTKGSTRRATLTFSALCFKANDNNKILALRGWTKITDRRRVH